MKIGDNTKNIAVGGKTVYTSDITFSSSKLINQYGDIYSNLQKSLINKIKKKYNFRWIY